MKIKNNPLKNISYLRLYFLAKNEIFNCVNEIKREN